MNIVERLLEFAIVRHGCCPFLNSPQSYHLSLLRVVLSLEALCAVSYKQYGSIEMNYQAATRRPRTGTSRDK